MRTNIPFALLFVAIGCGGVPFVGSEFPGGPSTPPAPLLFERGFEPEAPPDGAPYQPVGSPVVRPLDRPFTPVTFAASPDTCYALRLRFEPGASLSAAMRQSGGPHIRFRGPPGSDFVRLAHVERDGQLVGVACCNDDLPSLSAVTEEETPIGAGNVVVDVVARPFTAYERRVHDDARTPFLVGGAVVLPEPDGFTPTGATEVRRLEDFAPLTFTLAPQRCVAVTLRALGRLDLTPAATMESDFFLFAEPSDAVAPATRGARARVLAEPYCNRSDAPVSLRWMLVRRRGTGPGSGQVEVSRFERSLAR